MSDRNRVAERNRRPIAIVAEKATLIFKSIQLEVQSMSGTMKIRHLIKTRILEVVSRPNRKKKQAKQMGNIAEFFRQRIAAHNLLRSYWDGQITNSIF